jgi:hypothetical protein
MGKQTTRYWAAGRGYYSFRQTGKNAAKPRIREAFVGLRARGLGESWALRMTGTFVVKTS